MRNRVIGLLILILSSCCLQCTSKVNSEINKEEFIKQLDEECAKSVKELNVFIAQTKKLNQNSTSSPTLLEEMTQRLAQLSLTLRNTPEPQEDAALLGQFFQEDRNMRESLIKLEEISSAFVKVSTKSQTSPEQAVLLKEISAEENRLKNNVSVQTNRRNSLGVRYGFEACASIDPTIAWAQPKK